MSESVSPPSTSRGARFLELPEIAAWQIAASPAKAGDITADLPALQRGAVWKVKQVEELWDSILRGFPIGAFILSPPNEALLHQNFKHQQVDPNRPQGTHLLLDGQQRATAIALGFDDLWSSEGEKTKARVGALWVDLGASADNLQLEFVFRVLTRAHPWGYRRDNPEEILSSSAIRAALVAYRTVHGSPDRRPENFAIWETWPWEAGAPIPVALLIQAILAHPKDIEAARKALWERVKHLPMMNTDVAFPEDDSHPVRAAHANWERQQQAVRNACESAATPEFQRLCHVLEVLSVALCGEHSYRVPALLLDITRLGATGAVNQEASKDAIELMFVRINSAGTPLQGEELIYSLIKAEWPEVAKWMQGLPHRPALPSRIAALCVRLVLARLASEKASVDGSKTSFPAMPGMNEFRRLMRGANDNYPDFKQHLKDFIDRDAAALLRQAWEFLTLPNNGNVESGSAIGTFRLLPAQAVDLAQHSPQVFLLLLRWIDRMRSAGIVITALDEKIQRRTLGFLTAIAWFAPDKEKASASIWSELEAEVDTPQKLMDRFNATRMKNACRITNKFALKMIPLLNPDELETLCLRFISPDGRSKENKDEATIHFLKGKFWTDNNWWYGQFCKLTKKVAEDWQNRLAINVGDEEEQPSYSDLVERSAQIFLDALWGSKNGVLLYCQRQWLQRWFPKFDPSLPEMMEDKNRPWDIDHILPQNYFSGRWGIPQSVKDWGGSIGNLRAWPLEANRSDGDSTPLKKLSDASDEEKRYRMRRGSNDERRASFVDDELDWPFWQQAVPTNDETGEVVSNRYLANDLAEKYHDQRQAAMTAIILRFIALYRHWFDELRLGDLR